MKHPTLKGILILGIAVAVGYFVASQINGFLALSVNEKSLPTIPDLGTPIDPEPGEPIAPFLAIELPAGAETDELYRRASQVLADALVYRTGSQPEIRAAEDPIQAGRSIRVAADASAASEQGQGFALRSQGAEPDLAISVSGEGRLGTIQGLYYLADQLRAGINEDQLATLDKTIKPAMEYRFVDLGAVGMVPDPKAWRGDNYSHHSQAFEQVILPEAPFIDEAALAEVEGQFQEYVQRMVAFGYNGIIIDGFLEYIDFNKVGDGQAVYAADSPYRQQHEALRASLGEMFAYAADMGLAVIFKTDMLNLSPPLEDYFEQELGGRDPGDQALWAVYGQGLAEFFETFPYAAGLMIRIGEAGSIYNMQGWDYYSTLDVRTDDAVQKMLQTFTQVAADYDKTIFFRTWSVGVGEVGDMHTNPETYQRVLSSIAAANLVVSTKYTMGDYYSFLPLNPTLASGPFKRIIEFQARREFEAFNAFPNYLGSLHQAALQELSAQNPEIAGVWVWTQGGGPQRAGPWSLYPFNGFWQTYDDNVYATAQLAWDPNIDLETLTEKWVRLTLSDDPGTVEKLTEMQFLTRKAVLDGLYIGPFAEKQVLAMGLEPPPMMWIFEWDIVSGSSAALSAVYMAMPKQVDAAIAEGFAAVETVQQMQALVQDTQPDSYYQPGLREKLLASLAYEENLLETLAWYRQGFLSYYRWLDTGEPTAYQAWQAGYEAYLAAKADHLTTYGADLDFPAYNFFAAEAGMAHVERSQAMIWLARGLLLVIAVTFMIGLGFVQAGLPAFQGKNGFRALWVALVKPWRTQEVRPLTKADWLIVSLWPVTLIFLGRLALSSFLSANYLLLVVLLWGPFCAVLLLRHSGESRFNLWAAITAPGLLGIGLPMAVVAIRGPVFYWYQFWSNDVYRTLYVTAAVVASVWLLYVIYATIRALYGQPRPAVVGELLLAGGVGLLSLGAVVGLAGLDPALTAINDELAVLPLGLSRILGMTTHLGIPPDLPLYIIALGLVLILVGWLLGRIRPSRRSLTTV